MKRYFLEIAYRGTDYHGWQVQPAAVSVQGVIEEGLQLLLGVPTALMGSGRTDAGVHAMQQFAHFETGTALDTAHLYRRLNALLPKDILIRSVFEVAPNDHARYSALRREYAYHLRQQKDPFALGLSHRVWQPLNREAMQAAAQILLQYEDFEAFSKAKAQVKHHRCQLLWARWEEGMDGASVFHIAANRFLHGMVRAIVGTLIEIGKEKYPPEALHAIISSKDRRKAGPAAPPEGLFLMRVRYPEDIEDRIP
ncbi:MAG: tRNA pseudouridine(38-40) synthase TruA [Bernardetiaceae bacterium]